MNAADVLERAAELIQEHGWASGSKELAVSNRHCAGTALRCAIREMAGTVDIPLWSDAEHAIRRVINIPSDVPVPEWNDAPERTVEDVLLALKQAAHDLRSEVPA